MSAFTESTVEAAALEWFNDLGFSVDVDPHLALSEPSAERASFSDVILPTRLHSAIHPQKPAFSADGTASALKSSA